jgi:hypothetical protein
VGYKELSEKLDEIYKISVGSCQRAMVSDRKKIVELLARIRVVSRLPDIPVVVVVTFIDTVPDVTPEIAWPASKAVAALVVDGALRALSTTNGGIIAAQATTARQIKAANPRLIHFDLFVLNTKNILRQS